MKGLESREARLHSVLPQRCHGPGLIERADRHGNALGGVIGECERRAAILAEAARDDRAQVRITGLADGSAADRDPLSGSATLLAADRARAVALALNQAGVLPGDRIAIATAVSPGRRGVLLTMGFAGNRQDLAGRQCRLAGCPEPTLQPRTVK